MMRLDIAEIGQNIGYLIAGTLCNMAIHTFVVMPIIFIAITRTNPFTYMFRCGSALMVAWGTASSAATMPLTLREARKRGNPIVVVKFLVPLGTLGSWAARLIGPLTKHYRLTVMRCTTRLLQ